MDDVSDLISWWSSAAAACARADEGVTYAGCAPGDRERVGGGADDWHLGPLDA